MYLLIKLSIKGYLINMNKVALILGVSGMDGSHLADLLVSKNYTVYGIDKIKSEYVNLDVKFNSCNLHQIAELKYLMVNISPNEVYNLAGNTFIDNEMNSVEDDMKIVTDVVIMILEMMRRYNPKMKYFNASSVEAFKHTSEFSDEIMEYDMWNLYSIGKAYSHSLVKLYRNDYNLFAVNGILYPHESVRRKDKFVFKKIINGIFDIHNGKSDFIELGDIDAERYWGHAKDFVEAMWLTMQQSKSDDYIIGNPEKHSVRDILTIGFDTFGITDWEKYIKINNEFKRSVNKFYGCPNINKLKSIGWEPKYDFNKIVGNIIAEKMRTGD